MLGMMGRFFDLYLTEQPIQRVLCGAGSWYVRAHGRLKVVLLAEVQPHIHTSRPQRVHDHARLPRDRLLQSLQRLYGTPQSGCRVDEQDSVPPTRLVRSEVAPWSCDCSGVTKTGAA